MKLYDMVEANMSRMKLHCRLCGLVLTGCAVAVFGQGTGASLVVVPGVNLSSLDVTGDSACGHSVSGAQAVRWTRAGGVELLPRAVGWEDENLHFRANDISWNGRVICGATNGEPARIATLWRQGEGTSVLPDLGGRGFNGMAEFLSGNGLVAVGHSADDSARRVVVWDERGMVVMPQSDEELLQTAGVNFDGSRILVWTIMGDGMGTRPPLAIVDRDFNVLHALPNGFVPMDLSAAGTMVVGYRNNYASYWTPSTGVIRIPGLGLNGKATAVSADERYIVGWGGLPSGGSGWIWDAHHGVRSIANLVFDQLGVTMASGTSAGDISPDGRTILLSGGANDTIVFRMAAPCAADIDDGTGSGGRDDAVTIEDLAAFLAWMADGDLRADLDDGSGAGTPDLAITIEDFLFFLVGFESGC